MTKKTGVILTVLSLPVLVIGALHFNMIMLGLDESREPITLVITGAGVMMFAAGIAGATRPRNGILVGLAGAAIIVALFLRAKANGRRWHAELESDRAVADAVEAVCNGTPHTGATATSVPRAIMSGGRSEDKPTSWYAHDWEGLPKPATAADLQLVACIVRDKTMTSSCNYDLENHSSYSIYKYKTSDTITVRDAKTAKELGSQTFEGKAPSEKCDDSVKVSGHELSHDVSGESPSHDAETAFVKTFVTPAER